MTRVVESLHFDDTEDSFTVQKKQDVEPILEAVKANQTGGRNKAGDYYLAGSFPVVLVEAWLTARNLSMRDFKGDVLRQFLNDDAHSAFRAWKGRV